MAFEKINVTFYFVRIQLGIEIFKLVGVKDN
jgi:hypothetical protein